MDDNIDIQTVLDEYGWEDVTIVPIGKNAFVLIQDTETGDGLFFLFPYKEVVATVRINDSEFIIEEDALRKVLGIGNHELIDSSGCISISGLLKAIGSRRLDTSTDMANPIQRGTRKIYKAINGYTSDKDKLQKVDILDPETDEVVDSDYIVID